MGAYKLLTEENTYLQILKESITHQNLEIKPYVGVGEIKLGMPIEQVKKIVPNCEEYQKSKESKHPTLACDDLNIHIFFGKNGKCEGIEAHENSNISYKGHHFFKKSLKDNITFLQKLDPEIVETDDSWISKKLGIALWVEVEEDLNTVMVFVKGYYDKND